MPQHPTISDQLYLLGRLSSTARPGVSYVLFSGSQHRQRLPANQSKHATGYDRGIKHSRALCDMCTCVACGRPHGSWTSVSMLLLLIISSRKNTRLRSVRSNIIRAGPTDVDTFRAHRPTPEGGVHLSRNQTNVVKQVLNEHLILPPFLVCSSAAGRKTTQRFLFLRNLLSSAWTIQKFLRERSRN